MLGCPKIQNMTLHQRLTQLVGKSIEINAAGLALEPGILQEVCPKTFIRVQGELFVPRSLNFMKVFRIRKSTKFTRIGVRTTFKSGNLFFDIPLVQIGKDFIELQGKGSFPERFLMPINKVAGFFEIVNSPSGNRKRTSAK
ncbi:hypothetical protein PASE110613_16730 [Paenibacillus sediminis]|uniref:GRAM domain-containing protein n=1 Tax=Paenibacillus sediminis TaxID=664909 RepID=A0ABS4H7P8_9BACL|nr:hypothetical protein [Paenibacillus sediminis]MBP1938544.1 hypothetical protein [Paenibacillus sediminis]